MDREGGMSRTAYAARSQRLNDAIALKQTDRVPSVFYSMFWYARYGDITCQQTMYDYDALSDITRRILIEFQPDCYSLPHPVIALGPTMQAMDYKQLQWPGHGTDPNVSYQFIDKEYMSAAEYDDYIFDPTGFYLSKYLPRISGVCEGFARLPDFPGNYYLQSVLGARYFSNPAIVESFQAMREAGEEMQVMLRKAMGFASEMAGAGFPLAQGASAISPFDYFADYFRGSKGALMDMYRHGDKFLAAMDKAAVFIIRSAVAQSERHPCKIVFIPVHWAFDGLMSERHFKTYFWPPLRKVILGLIDAGLTPLLLWEGDCTSRMEIIADIPPARAIYWFERGDLFRAKDILGQITCLRGNVPPSLLNTGTPDEVDAYCRKLIEVVGKGGGFILDGGIGVPDEARHENVTAMFDAARKYRGG
jgi:methoxylated aromatic compound---corrinoid protein Co-methyltransferase